MEMENRMRRTLMDDKRESRILVVDDEANHRHSVTRVLMESNTRIMEAASGKAALETAKSFEPDLIILDILMPEMDGYEVCRRLKADPETHDIMVVLLSARPRVKDRLMGYEAGADDYLIKPFEPEELRAKCRILCRLKEARELLKENSEKIKFFAYSVSHDLKGPAISTRGFDIRESLGGFLRPLAVGAHQKGLELAYHVDGAVPERIIGDPTRLRQIIVNLVGNAVKFTGSGEVVVRVGVEGGQKHGICLHFSVSDTGIGIPLSQQAGIFEPFTQADGSITRRYGGTGLGLVISRALAELMEGRMWVESRVKQGTVFHFTALFSLPETPETSRQTQCMVPLKGLSPTERKRVRILLAEDNAVNRKLALLVLGKLGYTAQSVVNGEEAFLALQKDAFDLVLMDVQMPVLNGVEATRKIREMEKKSGGHVPIVALTANAMKGDRERYLAAGMDAYMSKPFKGDELQRVIEQITAKKTKGKIS